MLQNKYSFFYAETTNRANFFKSYPLYSSYSRFELVTPRTFILNPEVRQPTNNAVCFRSPIAKLLR